MNSKKIGECHAIKERYLLSANYNNGEIVSGSVKPIPNILVIAEDDLVGNEGKTTLLSTNHLGYFDRVKNDFTLGARSRCFNEDEPVYFYFPPIKAIAHIYANYGDEKFKEKLQECITTEQLKQSQGVVLNKKITHDLLKPPEKDDKHSEYTAWYNGCKDQVLEGFVLPRIKVLMLAFSSLPFINDEAVVQIWKHNTSIDGAVEGQVQLNDERNPVCIIIENPNKTIIDEGLYNIRVSFPRGNSNNYIMTGSIGLNDYYDLKENIKFSVTTPTADICMINADPIHLEEALIKQFPDLFKDVIKHTREMVKDQKPKDIPPGLHAYMHDISVSYEYTALAKDLITAWSLDKKDDMMSAGINAIRSTLTDEGFVDANLVIGIGLEAKSLAGKWDDLKQAVNDHKAFEKLVKQEAATIRLQANTNLSSATQARLAEKLAETQTEIHKMKKFDHIVNIPGWFKPKEWELQEAEQDILHTRWGIPPKYVHFYNRAQSAYDLVDTLSGVVDSFIEVSEKKKQAKEDKEFYDSTIKEYCEKVRERSSPSFAKAAQELTKIEQLTSSKNKHAGRTGGFKDGFLRIRVNLLFELDKDTVVPLPFNEIISLLNNEKEAHVTLHGHACPLGTSEYNLELSERRVKHIQKQLVYNGVPENKVTIKWYGEKNPLRTGDNINYEGSRRVEFIVSFPGGDWVFRPSRGGMRSLESARHQQITADLEVDKAIDAAIMATFDAACGIACLFPQAQLLANALMIAKDASQGVVTLAEYMDDFLLGNLISNYLAHKRLEKDLSKKSKHNQKNITLDKAEIGHAKNVDYTKYLNNQYRMRAEVLTGLVKLILRASHDYRTSIGAIIKGGLFKPNYEEYKKLIQKYRIDLYIKAFVLNKNWQYPHDIYFNYTLDQFWLDYLGMVDTWNSNAEIKPDDDLIANLIPEFEGAAKKVIKEHSRREQTIKYAGKPVPERNNEHQYMLSVNYQNCFAIHGVSSETIESMIIDLDINYAGLSNRIYKHTAIYVRPAGSLKHERWISLDEHLQKTNYQPLSPFDQIRAIVVLKKDQEYASEFMQKITLSKPILERAIPITLKPVRIIDNWFDVDGPAYTDMTQKLTADMLLEEENQFAEHYGAIFYPRYKLGSHIIPGIKPMSGKAYFNIDQLMWKFNKKIDMQYMLEVELGRNRETARELRVSGDEENYDLRFLGPDKTWNDSASLVPIFGPFALSTAKAAGKLIKNNYTSAFPFSIDETRTSDIKDLQGKAVKAMFGEDIFVNENFIISNARNYGHPELFSGKLSVSPMLRVGKRGPFFSNAKFAYQLPHTKFSGKNSQAQDDTPLAEFNWNDKVEMGFMLAADEIESKGYQAVGLDWRQISYSFKLTEQDTEKVGQEFTSRLVHLGKLKVKREMEVDHTSGSFLSMGQMGIQVNRQITNESYEFEADDVVRNSILVKVYNLQPFYEMLENINNNKAYLEQVLAILPHWFYEGEFHIYAGAVELHYKAPAGHNIDGLRPFGNETTLLNFSPDKVDMEATALNDFKFWVKEFATAGDSGAKDEHIKTTQGEQFVIPGVSNFLSADCPWTTNPTDPKMLKTAQDEAKALWAKKKGYPAGKLPNLDTDNIAVKWIYYKAHDKQFKTDFVKQAIKEWIESGINPREVKVFD